MTVIGRPLPERIRIPLRRCRQSNVRTGILRRTPQSAARGRNRDPRQCSQFTWTVDRRRFAPASTFPSASSPRRSVQRPYSVVS